MSVALRVAPLVFLAAVIQVSTISGLRVLGAEPDLLLVTIVAISLVAGSLTGAVAGFFGGLLVDVMTLGTLGTTSIVLILVGYWGGRYGETTGRGRAYAPSLAAFALTIVAAVGGVALHFLLGESVSGRTALVTVSRARPRGRARDPAPRTGRAAAPVVPRGRSGSRASQRPSCRSSSWPNAPYGEPRAPSSRFLPPDPGVEAPYRLTPGLAFRVGVLGVVALAVFAVLFFRLWSLQVLSGDMYLAEAQGNQLRTIRIEAPRGTILDRRGRVIVDNIAGTAVKLWVGDLPKHGRYDVIKRLAEVLERQAVGAREGGRRAVRRPGQPDHGQDRGRRGSGRVPLRAPVRVPGRPDPADVPAALPVPGARRPDARLRRRGVAGRARRAAEAVPPRRQGRQGRRRGQARRVPPRRGRSGADHGGLARPAAGAAPGPARRAPRQGRPAHDRHRAAAGGGAGAPVRDPDRQGERLLVRERRRARRARPARRRGPGDGLDADLQAVGLRRPGRPEEDRAARQRRGGEEGELPGDQPGDERRVSAGLDRGSP